MNGKKILFGIIPLLIMAGCVQINPISDNSDKGITSISTMPAFHAHALFQEHAKKNNITLEETKEFFREKYGIDREEDIFSALPPVPIDFEEKRHFFEDKNTLKMNEISAEIYLQPEFYPTFDKTGVRAWLNMDGERGQTLGLMSVPAEQYARVKANEYTELETSVFIASAWGVTEYQALGLQYASFPPSPIEVVLEPTQIRIGPTYPTFSKKWAEKVRLTVRVPDSVEPGEYSVRIIPAAPTDQPGDEEFPYLHANNGIGPSEGLLTLHLTVE